MGTQTKGNRLRRMRVLDTAWELAEKYLNDPEVSLKDKMNLVAKLVTKDIPSIQEISANLNGGIVLVRNNEETTNVNDGEPEEASG